MKYLSKILFIYVFLGLLATTAFSQEKKSITLGLGVGVPIYSWSSTGNLPQLRSVNQGMWGLNVYAQREFKDNWLTETNVSANRFAAYLAFQEDFSTSVLSKAHVQYQLNNLILRRINFNNSKISMLVGLGAGINYMPPSNTSYTGDEFKFIRKLDQDGNSVPALDLEIVDGASKTLDKVSLSLISKIGFNYKLSSQSSIALFTNLGYNFSGAVLQNDFKDISFNNNNYRAQHNLNPNSYAVFIGYEFKLR
jgi:hypothetical protein